MINRLDYIDISKGLCILLVVMGHILQFNCEGGGKQTVFNFIYSFHMPVFMLLSGYVANLSRDRLIGCCAYNFIKKKFVSLVIPFFIWGLVVMPVIVRQQNFSTLPMIAKHLLVRPDTGAWFIATLFCIQMCFGVFCLLANMMISKFACCKFKMWAEIFSLIVVVGVLLVSLKILAICSMKPLIGTVNTYFSVYYLLFFFVGYTFNRYFRFIVFNKWMGVACALAFFVLVKEYSFDTGKYQVFCGLFASVIVLQMSKSIDQIQALNTFKNIMVKYGRNSLVIYLTHFPIISILKDSAIVNTDAIASIPLFFIVAVASMPVCALCTYFGKLISTNSLLDLLLYGRVSKNQYKVNTQSLNKD